MISEEDKKALDAQDEDTLAKWWCVFNHWKWPEGMPNPEEFDLTNFSRAADIMQYIMETIGRKKCLREWNRDSMTDEEFNAWWPGKKTSRGSSVR